MASFHNFIENCIGFTLIKNLFYNGTRAKRPIVVIFTTIDVVKSTTICSKKYYYRVVKTTTICSKNYYTIGIPI